MIILLHSSKTMVTQPSAYTPTTPMFAAQAQELQHYLHTLPASQLQQAMHISAKLAAHVHTQLQQWPQQPPTPALFAFRGDIYSGLRALDFLETQVMFAQQHLRILSGLYGVLRALDGVAPYRLEAGYRLPAAPYHSLYAYWHQHLAAAIPPNQPVVNVTSHEYAKLLLPFIPPEHIITPRFLTRPAPNAEPTFIVVHAKIARGAFARWLIMRGTDSADGLQDFNDLGYQFAPGLSTPAQPTYVCDAFGGLGLSQRVTKTRP